MSHDNDLHMETFLQQLNAKHAVNLSPSELLRVFRQLKNNGILSPSQLMDSGTIGMLPFLLDAHPSMVRAVESEFHSRQFDSKAFGAPSVSQQVQGQWNRPPLHHQQQHPASSSSAAPAFPPLQNGKQASAYSSFVPTPQPASSTWNSGPPPPPPVPAPAAFTSSTVGNAPPVSKVANSLSLPPVPVPTLTTQPAASSTIGNKNNKTAAATATTALTNPQTPSASSLIKHCSLLVSIDNIFEQDFKEDAHSTFLTAQQQQIYLPGTYGNDTKCRFCQRRVVIGINDYATLIKRTTYVYNVLLKSATDIVKDRSTLPISVKDGVKHRQPQIPLLLEHAHPLPFPLPVTLQTTCDGGLITKLELKLVALFSAFNQDKSKASQVQPKFNKAGFVTMKSLEELISKYGSKERLNLFESPPYPILEPSEGSFKQGLANAGAGGGIGGDDDMLDLFNMMNGDDDDDDDNKKKETKLNKEFQDNFDNNNWIPDCIKNVTSVCHRLLPCGCFCSGLRGELPSDCPQCPIHEMDDNHSFGDSCAICLETLDHSVTFISGTYQHLTNKKLNSLQQQAARGGNKFANEITTPFFEYLYKMGLNGTYTDNIKQNANTSSNYYISPTDKAFDIDFHNPKNFLNTQELLDKLNDPMSTLALYQQQSVAGVERVAKQNWEHNQLPPPLHFLKPKNVCQHQHHYHCFVQALDENWLSGNRINFQYLRCPMCTLYIFHPMLIPKLLQHYIFEQYVYAKALQRLRDDDRLYDDELSEEDSEFYHDPLSYAMKLYVFYLCSICQKPYFGGAADCQMDMIQQNQGNNAGEIDYIPPVGGGAAADNGNGNGAQQPQQQQNALICLSCNPTPGKKCQHDDDYMVNKCKFCCSLSTYVCWSNTWFCDKCHDPKVWQKLVYSRTGKNKLRIQDYYQCASIKRQIDALEKSVDFPKLSQSLQEEKLRELRCDPKECPLKIAHPPNGFNFVLNCKKCESEGLVGNVFEQHSDSDDEEERRVVRLQGIKPKRVKAKRIKGPRTKLVKKDTPYVVTLFESDLKIFHQLSLYSYLMLYRILYDRHFILPHSYVYQNYLYAQQHGLSSISTNFNAMLLTTGQDKNIPFFDVLPFAVVKNDNLPSIAGNGSNSSSTSGGGNSVLNITNNNNNTKDTNNNSGLYLTTAPSTASLSTALSHSSSSTTTSIMSNTNPLTILGELQPQAFVQFQNVPSSDDILNTQRITVQFKYLYDHDHNGLIYFLGTMGHTQPWLNPHKRGLVECSCTTEQADFITLPPWGMLERGDVRHVTQDRSDTEVAYCLDLKLLRFTPTHYTLKHYTTIDRGCLRSWVLEGYSNGTWYSLDHRENDYSLNGRNSSATFLVPLTSITTGIPNAVLNGVNNNANGIGNINSNNNIATSLAASLAATSNSIGGGVGHLSTTNANAAAQQQKSFSQFRIRRTGPNSDGRSFLAMSSFELYGILHFPTIRELLTPTFKYYTDTAEKFQKALPRPIPPTNANTASLLLPNVVRFVLDNGIRFAQYQPKLKNIISILFEEDSLTRQYNNNNNNSSNNNNNNKIKIYNVHDTHFLTIPLPPPDNKINKSTNITNFVLMTRSLTHNTTYHNNRLDVQFVIAYNKPLHYATQQIYNDIEQQQTNTLKSPMYSDYPKNTQINDILTKKQIMQQNRNLRANWGICKKFDGRIIPSIQYLTSSTSIYNLKPDDYKKAQNTLITMKLKDNTVANRVLQQEQQHQKKLNQQHAMDEQRARAAEEEANYLRLHQQQQHNQQQQHRQQHNQQQQDDDIIVPEVNNNNNNSVPEQQIPQPSSTTTTTTTTKADPFSKRKKAKEDQERAAAEAAAEKARIEKEKADAIAAAEKLRIEKEKARIEKEKADAIAAAEKLRLEKEKAEAAAAERLKQQQELRYKNMMDTIMLTKQNLELKEKEEEQYYYEQSINAHPEQPVPVYETPYAIQVLQEYNQIIQQQPNNSTTYFDLTRFNGLNFWDETQHNNNNNRHPGSEIDNVQDVFFGPNTGGLFYYLSTLNHTNIINFTSFINQCKNKYEELQHQLLSQININTTDAEFQNILNKELPKLININSNEILLFIKDILKFYRKNPQRLGAVMVTASNFTFQNNTLYSVLDHYYDVRYRYDYLSQLNPNQTPAVQVLPLTGCKPQYNTHLGKRIYQENDKLFQNYNQYLQQQYNNNNNKNLNNNNNVYFKNTTNKIQLFDTNTLLIKSTPWIQIDFGQYKVDLTGYMINVKNLSSTSLPQQFIIEGSNGYNIENDPYYNDSINNTNNNDDDNNNNNNNNNTQPTKFTYTTHDNWSWDILTYHFNETIMPTLALDITKTDGNFIVDFDQCFNKQNLNQQQQSKNSSIIANHANNMIFSPHIVEKFSNNNTKSTSLYRYIRIRSLDDNKSLCLNNIELFGTLYTTKPIYSPTYYHLSNILKRSSIYIKSAITNYWYQQWRGAAEHSIKFFNNLLLNYSYNNNNNTTTSSSLKDIIESIELNGGLMNGAGLTLKTIQEIARIMGNNNTEQLLKSFYTLTKFYYINNQNTGIDIALPMFFAGLFEYWNIHSTSSSYTSYATPIPGLFVSRFGPTISDVEQTISPYLTEQLKQQCFKQFNTNIIAGENALNEDNTIYTLPFTDDNEKLKFIQQFVQGNGKNMNNINQPPPRHRSFSTTSVFQYLSHNLQFFTKVPKPNDNNKKKNNNNSTMMLEYLANEYTSGNLLQQIKTVEKLLNKIIYTMAQLVSTYELQTSDIIANFDAMSCLISPPPTVNNNNNTNIETSSSITRFHTAVYTSSTDVREYIQNSIFNLQQNGGLPMDNNNNIIKTNIIDLDININSNNNNTQLTLPTLLTTDISNSNNNIVWSSDPEIIKSPYQHDINSNQYNPWVIIDLGQHTRLQLDSYTLSCFINQDQYHNDMINPTNTQPIAYPRNFQLFGSIDGMDWKILAAHQNDEGINVNTPSASWRAMEQFLVQNDNEVDVTHINIPVENTMTSYGVPLYTPAYRFFCFIQNGKNSLQGDRFVLSRIDLSGLLISSSAPISSLPFPCDPSRYSAIVPPKPLV